jgi:methionine synthase I (cobalamin-dependent)
MAIYRNRLPQLGGELFLTDAGLETDLIFNRHAEIRTRIPWLNIFGGRCGSDLRHVIEVEHTIAA